uniref:S8 family serine peptidase n=1 Tax=Paractinoplanes polyasparticus TaxID=2856853 RepID=UPI0034DB7068
MVAIVDSGSYPHPDLRRNLLDGTDETTASPGSGKIDDFGHGTAMASLVGGHGKSSGSGLQGIAPSSKLLPIRITRSGKNLDPAPMAKGIKWATEHGAKVINVSSSVGPAFALQDSVRAALTNDIVVVAAAANASSETLIGYPGAIDGVLTVGSTGRDGKHSEVSAPDPKVQICAPGVDIVTALPKATYRRSNGTSNSTAIVSGAAALIRSKFPELSAREVVHRLTSTADDIGPPGRDDECGFGRLNIVKALTADVPPLEGGGNSAPGSGSPASSAPGVIRPEVVAPSTGARADSEPSGGGSALVFGGVAAVLAVVGALTAVGLRRRRRR